MHGHPLISFTQRSMFVSDPTSLVTPGVGIAWSRRVCYLCTGAPLSVLRTGIRMGALACFGVEEGRQHGPMSFLAQGIMWAKR